MSGIVDVLIVIGILIGIGALFYGKCKEPIDKFVKMIIKLFGWASEKTEETSITTSQIIYE